MIRFSGFEIDRERAELRGAEGVPIKIRPKTFEVLGILVENRGRVVSKQELMEAVWPSVHVSDDSLFQCIKELRTALGDNNRQLIKVVSGRGYMFDAEMPQDPEPAPWHIGDILASPRGPAMALRRWAMPAFVAIGVAVLLLLGAPALLSGYGPSTIAVMPVVNAGGSAEGAALSVSVTEELVDGLATIEGLRVVSPVGVAHPAGLAIVSELNLANTIWSMKSRLVDGATGEVHYVATAEVAAGNTDIKLVQTRLVANIGDQMTRALNLMRPENRATSSTAGRVAIEQASGSINQTSPERFAIAETLLDEALRTDPGNIDLQVALAGMRLRGIQMSWYGADQLPAKQESARDLLDSALRARPSSIEALEAQCRLLSALTEFAESLVACGQVLAFDPWNGTALYLIGLGQLHLGRFEDALASFTLAERYDTPAVSRWTWLLGAGWANLLLDRPADAIPLLERSIAITPASGRPYMLLGVAYSRAGRAVDAEAAVARAMTLRPNSTTANVIAKSPTMSPVFLAAHEQIMRELADLGLPAE